MVLHNKDEVVELFYDVVHKLQKQSRDHDMRPNVRNGQARCLYIIKMEGTINQRRLSEILNIRPTSLSETIKRLEEKGMINRIPDETDKRTYIISLTEKGNDEMEQIRKSYASEHKEWLNGLTNEELESFFEILTKISASFSVTKDRKVDKKCL